MCVIFSENVWRKKKKERRKMKRKRKEPSRRYFVCARAISGLEKVLRTNCCFFFGINNEGESDKATSAYAFSLFCIFLFFFSYFFFFLSSRDTWNKKWNGILMEGRLKWGSRSYGNEQKEKKKKKEKLVEDLEFQTNFPPFT